jgi:hypothetical protein
MAPFGSCLHARPCLIGELVGAKEGVYIDLSRKSSQGGGRRERRSQPAILHSLHPGLVRCIPVG